MTEQVGIQAQVLRGQEDALEVVCISDSFLPSWTMLCSAPECRPERTHRSSSPAEVRHRRSWPTAVCKLCSLYTPAQPGGRAGPVRFTFPPPGQEQEQRRSTEGVDTLREDPLLYSPASLKLLSVRRRIFCFNLFYFQSSARKNIDRSNCVNQPLHF